MLLPKNGRTCVALRASPLASRACPIAPSSPVSEFFYYRNANSSAAARSAHSPPLRVQSKPRLFPSRRSDARARASLPRCPVARTRSPSSADAARGLECVSFPPSRLRVCPPRDPLHVRVRLIRLLNTLCLIYCFDKRFQISTSEYEINLTAVKGCQGKSRWRPRPGCWVFTFLPFRNVQGHVILCEKRGQFIAGPGTSM